MDRQIVATYEPGMSGMSEGDIDEVVTVIRQMLRHGASIRVFKQEVK